jgi:hypothetical protein
MSQQDQLIDSSRRVGTGSRFGLSPRSNASHQVPHSQLLFRAERGGYLDLHNGHGGRWWTLRGRCVDADPRGRR